MLRTIFARFFLITVMPMIILQCVVGYIFYERHWDNISKRLEDNLIGEISVIIALNESKDHDALNKYVKTLGFKVVPKIEKHKIEEPYLQSLAAVVAKKAKVEVKYGYYDGKGDIVLGLVRNEKALNLSFSHKKLNSPTTLIFFTWMIVASILLTLIALAFMRNQIKAILELASIAEKFGKGQDVGKFKIKGAKEVRAVAKAFLLMKQRISRNIYYRTQLLAHISHDLRTPLTRIRLNTEFVKDKEIALEINDDIAMMEGIISEYLEFAKEEGNEKVTEFDVIEVIKSVIPRDPNKSIKFVHNTDSLIVMLRKYSIIRAISNIINNAIKFSISKVKVKVQNYDAYWLLTVEDDGKGISPKYYSKVFQPFFKIDKETEGFGLGLASVKSIVLSHGGKIKLARSALGGLSVIIKIPK